MVGSRAHHKQRLVSVQSVLFTVDLDTPLPRPTAAHPPGAGPAVLLRSSPSSPLQLFSPNTES